MDCVTFPVRCPDCQQTIPFLWLGDCYYCRYHRDVIQPICKNYQDPNRKD
jgi:hypothetical protein